MNPYYTFNIYGKSRKILKTKGISNLTPLPNGKIYIEFEKGLHPNHFNPSIIVKSSIKKTPPRKQILNPNRTLVRQIINGSHQLYYNIWQSQNEINKINNKIKSIFSNFKTLFSSKSTWNEFQNIAEVYMASGHSNLDNPQLHNFIDINGMICTAIQTQTKFSNALYNDMANFKVYAGGSHDSGPFIKLKNLGNYMEFRPEFKPQNRTLKTILCTSKSHL